MKSGCDVQEFRHVNSLPAQQPVLHFPGHEHPDLPLRPGINGLCRDPDFDRGLAITPGGASSLVEFCVDARGLWLHVAEGVRGVHLNGRPVQRLAHLYVGDTIHCEGIELQLADAAPRANVPASKYPPAAESSRLLLRGHGGSVHGQSVALNGPLLLGEGGLPVEGNSGPLGRLQPLADGSLHLRLETGAGECRLNGWPVTEAIVKAGDQLLLAPGCRYVLESPGNDAVPVPPPRSLAADLLPAAVGGGRVWRVPWLLLAATASALVLSALLWFGVR